METIKMLVFDIDDTLLPRGANDLPESTKLALKLVKEKGIEVLIATGRAFYFISDIIFKQVNPDYYVTINGHCLMDAQGKIIERHDISAETTMAIKAECKKHNIAMGLKFKDAVVCYHDYPAFWKGYLNNKEVGPLLVDNSETCDYHLKNDQAMGIFLIGNQNTILNEIAPKFKDLSFTYAYGDGFDIFARDVNKTRTIESIVMLNHFTWDNVMSFGDGENDIEMLKKAGIGVAMGNANDNVKKHADYITTNCDDDGIYHALKHYKIL